MYVDTEPSGADALILVDLQNDFLPGGALAVPGGDAVIPVANRLQRCFSQVVATRDWHPAEHGSFATNHPTRAPGDVVQLDGCDQTLWPVHCVQGTRGAALADGLEPCGRRREFLKGQDPLVDSYSGFFDNQRRHSTGLDAYLRGCGVRRVYIMGLATEYCVKATAEDALRLGYDTWLVVDGCRGINERAGAAASVMAALEHAGAKLIDSPSLVRQRGSADASAVARMCHPACSPPVLVAETPHLALVRRGGWDFVRRKQGTGVVAVIAVTAEEELLLVEQYRPPVDGRVIELPAGLVGDLAGTEQESLEEAARRELLEETGFRAESLQRVFSGTSSAGLTDETTHFLLARSLQRVTDGGGDAQEEIQVHRVPLTHVDDWLADRMRDGVRVDARVPSGLYLLRRARAVPPDAGQG